MKPITAGIYSYPKSGNTWVRQVVGNFFKLRGYEALRTGVPDISVEAFGDNVMHHEERPFLFYKSHSWYELTQCRGKPFQNDFILHVRRNPLDVFLSHLNYLSGNLHNLASVKYDSVDDCARTGLLDYYFGAFLTLGQLDPNGFSGQGTYFKNNLWWVSAAEQPVALGQRVFTVRYEDLLEDFAGTLAPFWQACGLPVDGLAQSALNIKNAIVPDGKFYWKMKRGTFLEYLSRKQIGDFVLHHRDNLARLGYLSMLEEAVDG